jgi:hypothetical protein
MHIWRSNAVFMILLLLCTMTEAGRAQGDFVLFNCSDSCELVCTEYLGRYPPNLPGMPWYIVNAYAAVDSVSRLATYEYITDSLKKVTDEVVKLGWYHYILSLDYNPVLYHHYWWNGTYTDRALDYVTAPRHTIAAMMLEYYERFGEPDSNADKIHRASGGIYEVYVHSMAHRADTGVYGMRGGRFEDFMTQHWCATAIIEDVLFGQCTNFPILELDGISYQTIRISTDQETGLSYYKPEYYNNTSFTVPGHRYLLFTKAYKRGRHGDMCSWWFFPQEFFLIDDAGNIHDPLGFFGTTETLSVESAKNIIRSWKHSLLHGN